MYFQPWVTVARALPTNRPILPRIQAPNSSPHTPSSASPVEHPALVTEEVTSMTTMGRNLLNHPPPPRPIAHKLARHSKKWHSADPESGELAHNRHTHKPPELLHPVAICLLLGACTKATVISIISDIPVNRISVVLIWKAGLSDVTYLLDQLA